MNEFFGSHDQMRRYHQTYLKFVGQAMVDHPVLDLGCGTGAFMELLRENGFQAMGIDLADEAVTVCSAKGLNVIKDDALSFLSDKHEVFATIICSHLIEHLNYEDACKLLDNIHNALIEGGRLILITPNPASLEVLEYFWLDPSHVRPYPLPLLVNMFDRAVLQVLAQGQKTAPGLSHRGLPRRFLLRFILGQHYGKVDSYIIGMKNAPA